MLSSSVSAGSVHATCASTVGRPDGVAMPGRGCATPPSGGSAVTRCSWVGPVGVNVGRRHCRQAAHALALCNIRVSNLDRVGTAASPNAEREMAGRPKAARSPTGKVRWIPRLSYSRRHSARIAIARAVTLQARRSLPSPVARNDRAETDAPGIRCARNGRLSCAGECQTRMHRSPPSATMHSRPPQNAKCCRATASRMTAPMGSGYSGRQ